MPKNDNQKGFIFTLDATLALMVALIALAGVARLGSPQNISNRYEDLQIEKYGKDAVRVLRVSGILRDAMSEFEKTHYHTARRIIRENLRSLLPKSVQFRVKIRDRPPIYPTTNPNWPDKYDNLKNKVLSTQFQNVPPTENSLMVLAWVPEGREYQFVENLEKMRPYWYFESITQTSEEPTFRSEIGENNYEYYDAVFIPDADIPFNGKTIDELKTFSNHGRLVVGGETLYQNQNVNNFASGTFAMTNLPIVRVSDDFNDTTGHTLQNMYAWHTDANFNHPVIRPFVICYKFEYDGDNIYLYDNDSDPVGDEEGETSGYDRTTATVLTSWGDLTESTYLVRNGVIVNEISSEGKAIYLNMNFVQCAITNGTDSYDWHKLAIRALGGGQFESEFKSVTVSVWRGERI